MRQDREKPATELTEPHKALIDIIQELGFEVIAEYPVGAYKLDCYLPLVHVGIEADGPMHSRRRDEKRDGQLLDKHCLPILRLDSILISEKPDYVVKVVTEFIHDFEGDAFTRKDAATRYDRLHGS